MFEKSILLVEDNPDDEELTIRALKKNNVTKNLVVPALKKNRIISIATILAPTVIFVNQWISINSRRQSGKWECIG